MLIDILELTDRLKLLAPNLPPGKIPVYSVEIGNYDSPAEPRATPDYHFYLFTDRKQNKDSRWNYVNVSNFDIDPLTLSRAIKICAHLLFPAVERVYYHDASFCYVSHFDSIASDFKFKDILLFRHPNRKSVKDEIQACVEASKGEKDLYKRFVSSKYENSSHNDNVLFASGFLGRNTANPAVCSAMNDWLDAIINFSRRDQISLPYILCENNIIPDVINLNIYYNKYLIPRPHANSRLIYRVKWFLLKSINAYR